MDRPDSDAGVCPPPPLSASIFRHCSGPRHSEGSQGVSSSPPTSEDEDPSSDTDDVSMGRGRPSMSTPEPVRLVFTDDSDNEAHPEPQGLTPPRASTAGGRKRTAEMSAGLDCWEALRTALPQLPHAKRRRQLRANATRTRSTGTFSLEKWQMNAADTDMVRD